MATINPTISLAGSKDGSTYQIIWADVTNADTCAPVSKPEYADKSIQVAGTFNSASVALQGSNDGTNYAPLNDPGGTVIGINAAGIKAILENTLWIKPVTTGGGGSQSLTISVLVHLANTLRT